MLKPIERMWEKCDDAKRNSDAAYFSSLMHLAEMIHKLTVLGLLAAINENTERTRYNIIYDLVRADGLGQWTNALNRILECPANIFANSILPFRRALTEKVGHTQWQFTAISQLRSCLATLEEPSPDITSKVQGKHWFHEFVQLRNRTRGHGATTETQFRQLSMPLECSLREVIYNLPLYSCEWAYIQRSLVGSANVLSLTQSTQNFNTLPRTDANIQDGLYVFFDEPRLVPLAHVNPDTNDLYLANGSFNHTDFECLSYLTNTLYRSSSVPYLLPSSRLPTSETEGGSRLEETRAGNLSNIPDPPIDYVARPKLERELLDALLDDRHPIVTLSGRGGIGKTSLALATLKSKSLESGRFDFKIWFSARDIDLHQKVPSQCTNIYSMKKTLPSSTKN